LDLVSLAYSILCRSVYSLRLTSKISFSSSSERTSMGVGISLNRDEWVLLGFSSSMASRGWLEAREWLEACEDRRDWVSMEGSWGLIIKVGQRKEIIN
jgi:hypothetical protein